jgi:hypothetical protein
MTVEELYEKLDSKQFQDPSNGDLFYNYYVYQYPPEKEYDIRDKIQEIKKQLLRPTNYIEVLTLNLFEEFCNFLDLQEFDSEEPSLLKAMLKADAEDPEGIMRAVMDMAENEAFMEHIHKSIHAHIIQENGRKHPYIFLYGIGNMFPYMRTNSFLTRYEKYNETDKFKIIVFYPGIVERNDYHLFGFLSDDHTYRATILMNGNE